MTKPNKQRAGLQKKVSSVFKGVSVPGSNRTAKPAVTPAPDRNAVSPNTKPDDSRPLSVPETNKTPESQVLPSQADGQSTATVKSSVSADAKIPEGRSVAKPAQGKESHSPVVPEPTVMYAPDVSAKPETTKKPAVEKSDQVDKPVIAPTRKKTADSGSPVSKNRQTGQSSIMRRLAESQEQEDTVAGSPSISSSDPAPAKSPVTQAVSEKKADSASPASTDRQKSRSPLATKLAQADKPTKKSTPAHATDTPASTSTNQQVSQSRKPRDVRQPETPPVKPALVDPFAVSGDEGGFLQQIKEKLIPAEGGAKDKVMVLLVPVLAIAMIFVFRQVLRKSPGKAKAAENKDTTAVAAVDAGDEILWTIPEPIPAMARDPLKLPEPDEPENQDPNGTANPEQGENGDQTQMRHLKVRDIVYSHDKATALVGNQIVRAGSKVNGITIVRINKDSVELERSGETWIQKVRD